VEADYNECNGCANYAGRRKLVKKEENSRRESCFIMLFQQAEIVLFRGRKSLRGLALCLAS